MEAREQGNPFLMMQGVWGGFPTWPPRLARSFLKEPSLLFWKTLCRALNPCSQARAPRPSLKSTLRWRWVGAVLRAPDAWGASPWTARSLTHCSSALPPRRYFKHFSHVLHQPLTSHSFAEVYNVCVAPVGPRSHSGSSFALAEAGSSLVPR